MSSALASSNAFRVTDGGVMIETAVSDGWGSAVRDGRVGYSEDGPRVMDADVGLMGVAGREWEMYHEKTIGHQLIV